MFNILYCTIDFQGKRKKNLFWLASIAPLVSIIISTLAVYLTRADKNGVKIVKHVKAGLNPISINQLDFNSPHVVDVAKIGLVVAVVALTVSDSFHFDLFGISICLLTFLFVLISINIIGICCCWTIFCVDQRIPAWRKQRDDVNRLHKHHRISHLMLCCNWY